MKSFHTYNLRSGQLPRIGPSLTLRNRPSMITIALLADHPETLPTLAQWFRAQWPAYFAGRTPEAMAQDFHAEAQRHGLPVRLVAFVDDGTLAGTVVLRERAMEALPETTPGLGGLFVTEAHRGQGVGSELVRACMKVARAQGYASLYAGTATADDLLARLGWQPLKTIQHGDEDLTIYACTFPSA